MHTKNNMCSCNRRGFRHVQVEWIPPDLSAKKVSMMQKKWRLQVNDNPNENLNNENVIKKHQSIDGFKW